MACHISAAFSECPVTSMEQSHSLRMMVPAADQRLINRRCNTLGPRWVEGKVADGWIAPAQRLLQGAGGVGMRDLRGDAAAYAPNQGTAAARTRRTPTGDRLKCGGRG